MGLFKAIADPLVGFFRGMHQEIDAAYVGDRRDKAMKAARLVESVYRVEGVYRETGEAGRFDLLAVDAEDANRRAQKLGFIVAPAKTERVGDARPASVQHVVARADYPTFGVWLMQVFTIACGVLLGMFVWTFGAAFVAGLLGGMQGR